MKLQNAKNQFSETVMREQRTVEKLTNFYSVMGNIPDAPGAVSVMATMLCARLTDMQVDAALERCAVECHFPVRLPDILARAGVGAETPPEEAEARRAWDTTIQYVAHHVQSDPHGNYLAGQTYCGRPAPEPSQRIRDTVRRTGGWRVYKTMTDRDFPHQQKRFFEEYQGWTAVERIDSSHMIAPSPALKQLATKSTVAPENAPLSLPPFAKKIPQPLTDAELRDRRELLRQQVQLVLARTSNDQRCSVDKSGPANWQSGGLR